MIKEPRSTRKTRGKDVGTWKRGTKRRGALFIGLTVLLTVSLLGCGTQPPVGNAAVKSSQGANPQKTIRAVGAENEYANVIEQIGGKYVTVNAIMSNPNVDPHSYEANTQDAAVVAQATLIVQNGLGYDDFMNHLEAGSPTPHRDVIDVAKALGYSANTPNPHLWYKPDTMPKVAALIAQDLEKLRPDEKTYFADRLAEFNRSLKTWYDNLNQLKETYGGTGVAVTEPVPDYLLEAAHLTVKTPWSFQASVMNGTDPSPQGVQIQENLLKEKSVGVLLYNQQAVDSATEALLKLAKENGIPVVGVYETMPAGHTYQSWMEDETRDIIKALKSGISTETLS